MKHTYYLILVATLSLFGCAKSADSSLGSNTGQGGSLARFTIAHNHLYIVDEKMLYTWSLANSAHPQWKHTLNVGFGVETIYCHDDKLFIGSQEAMYIVSLADPAQPSGLTRASHVRACDPVVANDSLAYVTVRSGSNCGGSTNMLMVYQVRDMNNPHLVNEVGMNNPWGLGIRDKRLYVCDGSAGLSVFDLSDPVYPQLIRRITGNTFYDVIPTDDLLIAMVQGGTALYSYGTGDSLVLMSTIAN